MPSACLAITSAQQHHGKCYERNARRRRPKSVIRFRRRRHRTSLTPSADARHLRPHGDVARGDPQHAQQCKASAHIDVGRPAAWEWNERPSTIAVASATVRSPRRILANQSALFTESFSPPRSAQASDTFERIESRVKQLPDDESSRERCEFRFSVAPISPNPDGQSFVAPKVCPAVDVAQV